MSSPKKAPEPHHTWAWGEMLPAVGETDGGLRRKLQRGVVKLELGSDGDRTRATLWDIARLRVSRHLCDLGVEAMTAFKLAQLFIGRAYKDHVEGGRRFSKSNGERQTFIYAVADRAQVAAGGLGFQIIEIRPTDSEPGLRELGRLASAPGNIIVPVHALIVDAWYALPHLTDDVAAWLRASSANMDALQLRGRG